MVPPPSLGLLLSSLYTLIHSNYTSEQIIRNILKHQWVAISHYYFLLFSSPFWSSPAAVLQKCDELQFYNHHHVILIPQTHPYATGIYASQRINPAIPLRLRNTLPISLVANKHPCSTQVSPYPAPPRSFKKQYIPIFQQFESLISQW